MADVKAIIAQLGPWLDQHRRTALSPQVRPGQGAADGSRFNGSPFLVGGEPWPACKTCKAPMPLFVQLNLGDLPEPYTNQFGEGLLQLFYCTACENAGEAWAPFDESSKLVRVASSQSPGAIAAPRKTNLDADPRQITGWTATREAPSPQEVGATGLEETLDFDAKSMRLRAAEAGIDVSVSFSECDAIWDALLTPAQGDKVGGWPAWVQDIEYPICPRCGATMGLVMQIASQDNVPFMFGDVGCGHITQCPTHKDVVAFGWACS